jgi:hypothetical protein
LEPKPLFQKFGTETRKIWKGKRRESEDSNYSAAELDAIRDIIYQVIPKLLFKNNNKKVSENTAKSNIYLMFVLP